jgi:hypothetical protein
MVPAGGEDLGEGGLGLASMRTVSSCARVIRADEKEIVRGENLCALSIHAQAGDEIHKKSG